MGKGELVLKASVENLDRIFAGWEKTKTHTEQKSIRNELVVTVFRFDCQIERASVAKQVLWVYEILLDQEQRLKYTKYNRNDT